MIATLTWTVFFLPLVAAIGIMLFTLANKRLSSIIGCATIATTFVLSALLFMLMLGRDFETLQTSLTWMQVAGFRFEFGILVDKLSALMLLIVTGVATGVFFFSLEYMHDDDGLSRYYACLCLFTFSMLGIVLSSHFLQTFIFWELVGLASYLLIGHWYGKDSAADASKKAFLTTRFGDVGFLIGLLMVWAMTAATGHATLNFLELEHLVHGNALATGGMLTTALLLIFMGVAGKSAQFPLHVWLPDAMEGPTPVSALIHAATMVAAGVYLLARTFFLFAQSPTALFVIACIGGLTALMAATVALTQNDIKKILAYSTLSQLGYMVMAVGLGSAGIAMFHLTTHAFFKAMLFLGAGSVIHATHTQDIWKMGGLAKKMPITSASFLIGFLCLAGIFPLSGFWSKDEILALAYQQNKVLFLVGSFTAFLTAVYMGRLYFTVFLGKNRGSEQVHESGPWIRVPLLVLAFLSVTAGGFGLAHFLHSHYDVTVHLNMILILACSAVAIAGIFLAYNLYGRESKTDWDSKFGPLAKLFSNKYYVDEFYTILIQKVQQPFAQVCNWFEETIVVAFFVNGTGRLTSFSGQCLRLFETGRVQFYALIFSGGLLLLAIYWIQT